MPILLLFLIGGSIGALAGVAARMRTHRARFNSVFAGILGALLGGLVLPRISEGHPLLLGVMTAAVLVVALIGVRRRLAG
ncbi:hypothetical protein IAG41_08495 [Sphingomonas sp. JC676]|uniref:hypothetical protein n=1 Tax=Sphingomonas sp. JC676 TaxID=2768065 RepID=UPI001657D673|nr:hypothetical protein [Sphingomonas sp. JC676]MBC9032427.1 hypothetical protein [Sphingomonas sp. JC676]